MKFKQTLLAALMCKKNSENVIESQELLATLLLCLMSDGRAEEEKLTIYHGINALFKLN